MPYFRERRGGTLINVTSSIGIAPMPLVSAYAASKFAIEGFTESLGYELSSFGIRTRIVQPGYSPTTALLENGRERMNGLLPPAYAAYAKQFMTANAGGKITLEIDVAKAIWHAATDPGMRLRYPAGADAEALAELRRSQPGEAYLETLRATLGPRE